MTDRGPVFVSAAGRRALETELAEKRRRHKEICEEREQAFELSGDGWHDNPHFNHLQQLEANMTREVALLDDMLQRVREFEVQEGARATDRVRLGSVVRVLLTPTGDGGAEERVFEVGGFQESDPGARRVGYNAPLAGRILGLEPGDSVLLRMPNGEFEVEVIALHADARPVLGR